MFFWNFYLSRFFPCHLRYNRELLLICLILLADTAFPQKYNFKNFNVEQGLIQSEASGISQDKDGFLWVSTYGGISRFDGKEFVNATKVDGLPNSFCITIHVDKQKQVWIGTQNGLSVFDGRKYRNYQFSETPQDNFISQITEDAKGDIWVVAGLGKKLLHFKNGNYRNEKITDGNYLITAVSTDKNGSVWAALFNKGLYQLTNEGWQLRLDSHTMLADAFIRNFCFGKDNTLWAVTNKSVFSYLGGRMQLVPVTPENKGILNSGTIAEGREGTVWLGSGRGAYRIQNNAITHFDESRGLTDKTILKIFLDKENNLWFATDGDGLFRYSGDMFSYFDKSSGLGGSLIMGIAEDNNHHIWMGVAEKSLARFDGKKIDQFTIPTGTPATNRINSLFKDASGNLWIATSGNGIWVYDGKKFTQPIPPGMKLNIVNVIWQDDEKNVWFSTPQGCFYYNNSTLHQIGEIKEFTSSYLQLSDGAILIGASSGIYVLDRQKRVSKIDSKRFYDASVFCLGKWKDNVLLGTSENGLLVWNRTNNRVKKISQNSGMSSDFIYSILVDTTSNTIWCGTGRGINRIQFQNNDPDAAFTIKVYSTSDGLKGLECNMNVVLKDAQNRIWFGTNKGALIYNPVADTLSKSSPRLVLKSVTLNSENIGNKYRADTLQSWYLLPDHLKLAANENHLTFHFTSVSLSEQDSIYFQYKLQGLENRYSSLTNTPFVVYSGLPYGKYVFKVKAVTANGSPSENEINFSFEIEAPFYKTFWFQLLIIVFFIAVGVSIQWLIAASAEKRKRFLQQLRDDEQNKIRQKTSEDFHDEMGNKLTRITVLSDILQSRLHNQDYEKNIVKQIRDNAGALYRGTKDILWSLDPSSDNFHEILNRIQDFGNELFQDTPIRFSLSGQEKNYANIKLPLDYSRNILMIFKEALNNVLKHSNASNVSVTLVPIHETQVKIVLQDDGIGIKENKNLKGQGLQNMHVRAKRINSHLEIRSGDMGGTELTLFLIFPPM